MNVHDQAIRNLVSIEDLADHLGVSVRHVRRLVSERRIPFYKWGGRLLRFDIAAANRWLESTRVNSKVETTSQFVETRRSPARSRRPLAHSRSRTSTTPDPPDRADQVSGPTKGPEGGERADGA